MEIVRLTKPNAIVVSTVDSKSVFKKAWSLQVTIQLIYQSRQALIPETGRGPNSRTRGALIPETIGALIPENNVEFTTGALIPEEKFHRGPNSRKWIHG